MVTICGTGIDLNNILDKFCSQGLRSKVKVIRSKNVLFGLGLLLFISHMKFQVCVAR